MMQLMVSTTDSVWRHGAKCQGSIEGGKVMCVQEGWAGIYGGKAISRA